VFGGTFDPPHVGHVIAAVSARSELGLERCLMIPANVPWQKAHERRISSTADRLAMLRLAVEGLDGVAVSGIEIERGGESFTADTLSELAAAGHDDIVVIIGSDVAPQLATWRRADELRQHASFAVYDRADSIGGRAPEGWTCVGFEVPLVGISSTLIRARVKRGQPIDGLVPTAVARYIRSHHLYRTAAR
jgi:nicotinate-nucleotide adenylyltransferase